MKGRVGKMKKRMTLTERIAKKKAENPLQDRSATPQDRSALQDRSTLDQSTPQGRSNLQDRSTLDQSTPQDRSALQDRSTLDRKDRSATAPLGSNRKAPVTPSTSNISGVQNRMATSSTGTSGLITNPFSQAGNRMVTSRERPTLASTRVQATSREAPVTNMRLRHENMIIESKIPISEVTALKMINQLGEHGRMALEVVIDDEQQLKFLQTNYHGQNIQLFQHREKYPRLIFNGHIETIAYEKQSHLITASIEVASYSTMLDQVPRRRSFQNTSQSFRSLCDSIIGESSAELMWEAGRDSAINKPFVQFDETNFAFMKRILSHLRRPIQVSILSEKPHCYAGVRDGDRQAVDETTIINMGTSDAYYEKDGYARGEPRSMYDYVKVRHRQLWQIGDFVTYRKQRLTVVRQEAVFEKGELLFIYTLGAAGFLRESTIYSDHLIGLSLQGKIRQARNESIQIQLDIDQEEQAHYFWPWAPEINNFGYVMPEAGSRVVLTFSTADEKDAIATHLLRTNSGSPIFEQTENKIMKTIHDQMIGLFPDRVLFMVKDNAASMSIESQTGIQLDTIHDIRMNAQQGIIMNGNKVNITAPEQILMQTSQSNIQMAGNFNFFAPGGVGTSSDRSLEPPPKQSIQAMDPNLLPLAFAAEGALPTGLNPDQMSQQDAMNLMAEGALPSVGRGETVMAISEVMNGEKAEVTSFPKAFESLGSHAMLGGKPIPKNRK